MVCLILEMTTRVEVVLFIDDHNIWKTASQYFEFFLEGLLTFLVYSIAIHIEGRVGEGEQQLL